MTKNIDITGIGYSGLDHVCLLAEIPRDSKTQVLEHLIQGGGPCATGIFTAARLGAQTAIFSVVGDDMAGQQVLNELQKESVDISGILSRQNATTAISYCWAEKQTGHRSIAWTKGDAQPLQADEVNLETILSAKVLYLDGHQEDAAFFAAEKAQKNGVKVFLDAGTLYPHMKELMKFCDIIIASENCAKQLAGNDDINQSLKIIKDFGPEFVAVTLGAKGAIGFDGNKIISKSAHKIEVVDTTGAGDVYHGAFAYQLSKGNTWEQCMDFASATAALKCRSLGGRTGIPTLEEVEKFLI